MGTKRGLVDESSIDLWHKCLGYISKERMRRLVKNEIHHDLDLTDLGICVDVLKENTQKTQSSRRPQESHSSLVIHADICGPFDVPSFGGKNYFITFTITLWICLFVA